MSDEAFALYREGAAAFRQGDVARSRELNDRSLALARSVGDARGIVRATIGFARLALRRGDYAEVHRLAAEARAVAEAHDVRDVLSLAVHLDAAATRLEGDLDGAAALYRASLELGREHGDDRWIALEESNLAWLEIHRNDLEEAERLFTRCRRFAEETGDAYGVALCLAGFARVAAERGDGAAARAALAAADDVFEREHLVLDPDDEPEVAETRALVDRLG